MVRRIGLTVLLLLAACAGNTSGGGSISQPVTTAFAPGSADVIEVQVTDPLPVQQAELHAPDGRIFLAYQIDHDRVRQERGGYSPFGIGLGVFGGSASHVGTSVGIGLPFGGIEPAPREPQVMSLARIRVEDMAAYRTSWPGWKLRLRLGDANPRFMELPAPRPPEG